LQETLDQVLERQCHVLTRSQARHFGIGDAAIHANIAGRRWQRVLPGVYATFTGPLSFRARVWAAVLYAGDGAVASHATAAQLWGIADNDGDTREAVHVTVPTERRVAPQAGIRVHRSARVDQARHPVLLPPRTRVEETVLDLVDEASRFEPALAAVLRAVQRRRTTPAHLRQRMTLRKKLRWRSELAAPLDDIADGAQSILELRFGRRVERPHGLPRGRRQRRWTQGRRQNRWTDVRYIAYGTRAELDGRIGHEEDGAFRDMRRDNAGVVRGDDTLRYGWADVADRACEAAGELACVLTRNGWSGVPRRCGPACRLPP
jgi:hypothetical protein